MRNSDQTGVTEHDGLKSARATVSYPREQTSRRKRERDKTRKRKRERKEQRRKEVDNGKNK